MDLSKIMTVSGKPGLFKVVAQTRNGLIVESMQDGKRMPVFATDRSSTLEDISVFTYEKDVPLKDVLWAIHKQYEGKEGPDPKSTPDELKAAFEKVLPDYDKDRVHVSDMKKIFAWYRILLDEDMISDPEAGEDETEDQEAGEQTAGAEKDTKEKDNPDKQDNT